MSNSTDNSTNLSSSDDTDTDAYDDASNVFYDILAAILLFYFSLGTFAGLRFQRVILYFAMNIWAASFALIIKETYDLSEIASLSVMVLFLLVFNLCAKNLAGACVTLMGGMMGYLIGCLVHDFFGEYLDFLVTKEVDWTEVTYFMFLPMFGILLIVFTDSVGAAIMWAFTSAYFGVAGFDWIGFRLDYVSEPRLWMTNFMTNVTTLESCDRDAWCIGVMVAWMLLTLLGLWSQILLGPEPKPKPPEDTGEDWEPLMSELHEMYGFQGEALEEMAKLKYEVQKNRLFREKVKHNKKKTKTVMKQIAAGEYMTKKERDKARLEKQAAEASQSNKRTWYGSLS